VKPPKKRPPETGTLVGVRVQQDLLDAIDAFRRGVDGSPPTRPEAMRFMVLDWLISHGLLEPEEEGPEGE